MLASLSIRDVVLIDRLDLSFQNGLCVLTGETGAGKSILLDALGLALGNRADQRLLRPGAKQASVSAGFAVAARHPALGLLAEQGLSLDDDVLVLRRVLDAEGRSRAFVNDQPVSVGLLRAVGDSLIEVQGQFEQRGLLDAASHRLLLDGYAGLEVTAARVAALWQAWRAAVAAHAAAERELARARAEEAQLRHDVEELEALDPKPGEADALAEQRAYLMHAEQLIEAVNAALAALTGDDSGAGAEASLAIAQRKLERQAGKAAGRLDPVLEALGRAAAETIEARALLETFGADLDLDPKQLEKLEERLFALKDLARKHGVEADALAVQRDRLRRTLDALDQGGSDVEALARQAAAARQTYVQEAEALSAARAKSAKKLDRDVALELPPLKLEKARFHTQVERLPEDRWGHDGLDRVAFAVATNPGTEPGPLAKIASGGELSRFLLALKVVLAKVSPEKGLVFDEVDSAIGGATAHAVGERLARLAKDRQVLVITHSPQVAARGAHHWQVRKVPVAGGERLVTQVGELSAEARREELARMLSGAVVTDEARAAADRLIGAA